MHNTFNELDLLEANQTYAKAKQLCKEAEDNLKSVKEDLNWYTLSIVKYTRDVALEMDLIDDDTVGDAWIEFCKDVVEDSGVPVENMTIDIFVDFLFWKSVIRLVYMRKITSNAERYKYIETWFPGLQSRYFQLEPEKLNSTAELSVRLLTHITSKENNND